MTEFRAPVFVPYGRFLEVRARRLRIAADPPPPDGQTRVAACSISVANDESTAPAAARLPAPGPNAPRVLEIGNAAGCFRVA